MPASPIRKLAPLADEARRRGIKVYGLNIGQPDVNTPEEGIAALHNYRGHILDYSPSQGILSLRKKLCEYYSRFDMALRPDEICITTGGSEALLFTFLTCFDPGDEIIVTDPGYANYLAFANEASVNVKSVPTHIEDGFALPPVEAFEKAITPRTRAILICNPNNPTGAVYTDEALRGIADMVKKYGLWWIVDEAYREFCFTKRPFTSALHFEDIREQTVLIDSVSKRYSECGIRIGCVATHNAELMDAIVRMAQARLSPPLLGQIVADASIDCSPEYLEKTYDEYLQRRNVLVEGLNSIPGVYSPMPMGAFYTTAELPVDNAEDFCRWCLTDFSYEGATVFMAPAAGFYTDPELGRRQVRIAYVLKVSELLHAVEVLRHALEEYNQSTSLRKVL